MAASTAPVATLDIEAIAPCLSAGPLAVPARALVDAADSLGDSPVGSQVRAWVVPFLFGRMEEAFASGEDPTGAIQGSMTEAATLLASVARSGFLGLGGSAGSAGGRPAGAEDTAEVTGRHYGRLFAGFSDTSYWDEPVKLLRTRLERNGVGLERLGDARVLDSGCGGGRYTAAWGLMGAREAVGIDISDVGIRDAERRTKAADIRNVTFVQGSVLDLPFPDDDFDIVFSNGVLHHTVDWRRGIEELVRVLRPGGTGWLYLIENPGGYFWDVIEVLRAVTRNDDRDAARASLTALGIPGNRVFYMLDHVMVPINVRLSPEEIEDALASSGASGIRRLERGVDFDRIERIHAGDPFAQLKYGVGENRYVFTKP